MQQLICMLALEKEEADSTKVAYQSVVMLCGSAVSDIQPKRALSVT